MIRTPHRAFGYVVYRNTWESGETYQYNYPEGRMWLNFFTAGSMINNTFENGSKLPDYHAGDWIGLEDMGPHGICNQTPVQLISQLKSKLAHQRQRLLRVNNVTALNLCKDI